MIQARMWLATGDQQHRMLVRSLFKAAGGWRNVTDEDRAAEAAGDPLDAVGGRAG